MQRSKKEKRKPLSLHPFTFNAVRSRTPRVASMFILVEQTCLKGLALCLVSAYADLNPKQQAGSHMLVTDDRLGGPVDIGYPCGAVWCLSVPDNSELLAMLCAGG